ncbi:MAG: sigma-70 family RNA polymerase sigma factor [Acidobacteria bacterium]|nr:sigma-70 family RNA polymerase sigma factor [Acidobacteriota bacterium]
MNKPLNKAPKTPLESLFREHYDRVYRAAYRVTGSATDAEDVLQTVFLRLARQGGELNLEPHPASYLHRAAVNASLDLLRQRGRAASVPLEDAALVSATDDPARTHHDRELQRAMREAVAQLNDNQAQMFALKYFEGYDNQQIAELLGTSPMVVGVLLHRARARVKKALANFVNHSEGGKA